MFCTNCGKQIEDNLAFCTNCGAKIGSTAQGVRSVQNAAVTPAPQAGNAAAGKKKGKLRAKHIILIIVGVILFFIILSWCSNGTENNVLDVNLRTLVSEVENNSARANQTYGGKTLRITGIVADINNDFIYLSVSNNGYFGDGIYVYFSSSSEINKLMNLNKGQRITVRGVYDGSIISCLRRAVIE